MNLFHFSTSSFRSVWNLQSSTDNVLPVYNDRGAIFYDRTVPLMHNKMLNQSFWVNFNLKRSDIFPGLICLLVDTRIIIVFFLEDINRATKLINLLLRSAPNTGLSSRDPIYPQLIVQLKMRCRTEKSILELVKRIWDKRAYPRTPSSGSTRLSLPISALWGRTIIYYRYIRYLCRGGGGWVGQMPPKISSKALNREKKKSCTADVPKKHRTRCNLRIIPA